MKKLMIAAALVAGVSAAQADLCAPEAIEVARVYQIQLNTYTTCGHAVGITGIGGGQCGPGESTCTVLRGKDKTVIRGYVYVCADVCNVEGYSAVLCDVRRRAFFKDGEDLELNGAFEWNILNIMGSQMQDAEAQWKLTAACTYAGSTADGDARTQTYELVGAGYGKFNHNAGSAAGAFFDNFGGYFAGAATPSFDLKTSNGNQITCACDPSNVLTCDTFAELDYAAENTVAFGVWKMKYNHNVTEAYLRGQWSPLQAIQKMLK